MYSATVKSYAKINLTLDILGQENGFHLLDSFVANLDIFNSVTVKKRKDKLVSGRLKGMGMDFVPFENTNACKVAEAFVEKFGVSGVDVTIYENIPVGAGLGGSSADSAGVLKAMCKLFGVDVKDCHEIANEYGSDIRYMLDGGFARMTGRGENIKPLGKGKIDKLNLLKIVISPTGCTDLTETHTAIQTHGNSSVQQRHILKQPLLQNSLMGIGHDLHLLRGAALINGTGNGIGGHITIGNGALTADI